MKKELYAFVKYKDCKKLWIYKCDASFKVNDVVVAPTLNYKCETPAIIKKIKFLSPQKLPIEKNKILTISKNLDFDVYEKDFYPIKYMRNYIKKKYLDMWDLKYNNKWVKVYISKFNGQISYEKDGVLTCSLNSVLDKDYFEQYTLVGLKSFGIKLKFIKTLLTELYYGIISQKEFIDLFNLL